MKADIWRLDRSYLDPAEGKTYVFRQRGGTIRYITAAEFWGRAGSALYESPVRKREYILARLNEGPLSEVFNSFDDAYNELRACSDPRVHILSRVKGSTDIWRVAA